MEALGDERTQAHGSHSAEGNHVQSEGRDGGLSWGVAGARDPLQCTTHRSRD